jgi:PEP-CTERM motif
MPSRSDAFCLHLVASLFFGLSFVQLGERLMQVNLCLKNMTSSALAIVLVVGLVASANAQKILFDLGATGDYRSVSVPNPDPNGNYWNSVSSCCYFPSLLDTNGNATSVNFGFSAASGNDSYNGPAGPTDPPPFLDYLPLTTINAAALGDLGVKEAAFDYYTGSNMQIQNLDPNKKYNLTFFGSHQYNDDNDTTRYTIYTDGTFATPITSVDLVVGGNGFWNQDQVATLTGLSPQPDNILYIGFAGSPRGGGFLNSMELTAVPEPSSMLLLLGAAASILAFRKRK